MEKYIKDILDSPANFANKISIDKLVDVLKQLSEYYYNTDEPLVPDSVFDILRDTLTERDPTNPFLSEVGAPISKDTIKLPFFMASMNKIKGTEEPKLKSWTSTYKGPYVLSDKLDGVSGLLYKKNNRLKLYTRGDGIKGQDITHLIKYVIPDKKIANKIEEGYAIRGELIISRTDFQKISDKFKNARNTVAGLVNSKNYSVEVAELTKFVPYEIVSPRLKHAEQMEKLKEIIVPVNYTIVNKISKNSLVNYLTDRWKNSEYEIDGIIVADDSRVYDRENKNPSYAFAFKVIHDAQMANATVKKVIWNVSKDGYLKPKVEIDPVDLVGVTITNATAFNAKYVVDNKLGPGAVIKIIRSGDVIPHIVEVLEPAKGNNPQMPDTPYKWNKTNVDIIATDIHGAMNNSIKIQQIVYFFKTLGVKYISEGIVIKLVENKYDSIPKILNARISDLSKIDGIGEKLLSKIFDNIRQTFDETELEVLMAASGSFGRGMGVKRAKMVLNKYPDIMVKGWDIPTVKSKILLIQGFDETTAAQFADNFHAFLEFFKELEKIERINVEHIKVKDKVKITDTKFKNQKVVFTGFRSKEWEEFIIKNGGEVSTGVSKNTTLLVHKNSEDSSKYKKAIDLNIKVMTYDEFENQYFS